MEFKKYKPFRSEKYKAFIRSLPCVVCSTEPTEAAHQRIDGMGGMGVKPPDSYCLPLCYECHAREHQIGAITFWANAMIDRRKEIIVCLTLYLERVVKNG